MANRDTDAQTGQRARLGQCLAHQQVRIAVDQLDRRLAAEVDVGLVHQHHGIRIGLQQLLDGRQTQNATGRSIGIGEDDAAIGARIILDANLELLIQSDRLERNAVQTAVHRVEAVGHVGEQQRFAVLKQAMEGMRQHFVGAVADKHLRRAHTVVIGHGLLQAVTVRIRVQTQAVIQLGLHGRNRLGRRAIGILVGIELDQLGQLGLLTRHIGHQILDEGTPEFAHAVTP